MLNQRLSRCFPFSDLIDIGIQCVKNSHSDFDPIVKKIIGKLPEFIELILFSDMFFIIFDNIRKHSGIERPVVEITASQIGNKLKICVINDIAPAVHTQNVEAKMAQIRKVIDEDAYHQAVRTEGGHWFD